MTVELAQSSFLPLLREVRGETDTVRARQFTGELLEGLDLGNLEFEDTAWRNCRFVGCDFTRSAFYRATFADCLFSGCRFRESDWRNSSLTGCKGEGGDFLASRFKGWVISDTALRYANFTRCVWDRTALCRCDLREAALSGMRLSKVTLERVELGGAELFRTSLAGVDLTTCGVEGIVVSEGCGELRGAKIRAEQAAVVAHLLGMEIVF